VSKVRYILALYGICFEFVKRDLVQVWYSFLILVQAHVLKSPPLYIAFTWVVLLRTVTFQNLIRV